MKYHLSGNDPGKNARPCQKVLPEVRIEIREMLLECSQKRWKKKSHDINVGRKLTQTLKDSNEEAEVEKELFRQLKKNCQEETS